MRRSKGRSTRWARVVPLIGLGLTVLAGSVVFFVVRSPNADMLRLVAVSYQSVSEEWDENSRRPVRQWSGEIRGGIGVFIADNEVLTCACAAGWSPIDSGIVSATRNVYSFDLDPYLRNSLPVRWWIQFGVERRPAYPVLVMPKGYSIVVLRVDRMIVDRFPVIASRRPQNGASVWVVGDRNELYRIRKVFVPVAEMKNWRFFGRQDTVVKWATRVTILAMPWIELRSDEPRFLEGAPVLDFRGELCGILHGTSQMDLERLRHRAWVMEPLDEVKESIEAVLKR